MSAQEDFIATFSGPAQEYQKKTGILSSIVIAQAALETGWGKFIPRDKYTGKESFNLFGVKGDGPAGYVISDTREYRNGKEVVEEAKFRAYHNWEESIADHNEVLLLDIYKPVRQASYYKEAAMYLQTCGYATDPFYAQKLVRIIEEHSLAKYDVLPVSYLHTPIWALNAIRWAVENEIINTPKGSEDFYRFIVALYNYHRKRV